MAVLGHHRATNSQNEDYTFCATDIFIHNTAMKKVKLIRLFII